MRSQSVACFTFDNMGEAAEVGAGRRLGPIEGAAEPSLAVGYPNLYALTAAHGVRATFFVEGWNGVHHPEAVATIVERGHELAMHGWAHESWSTLDAAAERDLAERATAALARAGGVRPRGFRAPGGSRTAATERVLREIGYEYDASLGDGMQPRRLATGLAQIPFVWPCVDGFHYLRPDPVAPATVRDRWLAKLAAVAEGGGLFLLVCHAFLTGVDPEKLAALDAVMEAAVRDPRVTVRTAGEIAAELPGAAGSPAT